jgi:hypothetical protein
LSRSGVWEERTAGDNPYVRVRMVVRSRRDECYCMNFILLVVAVCMLIGPVTATGQELIGPPSVADSGTIAYVRIKANRIGISTDTIDVVTPRPRNDSTASGVHVVDHIRHTVIGGFFGALGGAAIGAGIGAVADARSNDGMIPATAVLGIYGAIGGLAIGLITGAVWPVR